jgi:putative PIN family toxin of toxin-antitoxin system
MKPHLVLDTNVILDLLVFKDPATEPIRLALDTHRVDAVRTAASLAELMDVIQRPIFKLNSEEQEGIVRIWVSNTRLLENSAIEPAPFTCRDPDDQVFIDLAYSLRPALLLSKDLRVLELRSRALLEKIEISSDYTCLTRLLTDLYP